MSKVASDTVEKLAGEFRWFAEAKCRNSSSLYEAISYKIAEDKKLLALAAHANKPAPNILFGAVHFLLLKGVQHPLALFYPGISAEIPSGANPYPAFRSFCLDHDDEIQSLISTRFVQTNEVRRCSFLFPAFSLVSRLASQRPLTLLEVGTSAGLNLIPDYYCYNYGGADVGAVESPVRIKAALRGKGVLPLPTQSNRINILNRIGVDLHIVNPDVPEDILWLRALIWPEHRERVELLLKALDLAKDAPISLVQGDAVRLLPEILPTLPGHAPLCIYHTYSLNQFSPKDRENFFSIIEQWGTSRELHHLSCEWGKRHPQLELVSFSRGVRTHRLLAYCDLHGKWVEWLGA